MGENRSLIGRDEILTALTDALAPLPWTHAMWEGGAAAFGRLDEWSDLDLQVVVDDERLDDLFEVVEDTLAALSPIDLRFELPQPTWHGHAQVFYLLRDTSEYLVIDFVGMRRSNEERFLEPERHGEVVVYFDKGDVVQQIPVDRQAWQERLRKRLETLRVTFPMFQSLTKKELNRGNDVEAVAFYHGYTLRPLIEVLRMRYVPFQHDYHTRYVHYDLPPEVQDDLRALFFVADPEDLAASRARAEALFYEVLQAIDLDSGLL